MMVSLEYGLSQCWLYLFSYHFHQEDGWELWGARRVVPFVLECPPLVQHGLSPAWPRTTAHEVRQERTWIGRITGHRGNKGLKSSWRWARWPRENSLTRDVDPEGEVGWQPWINMHPPCFHGASDWRWHLFYQPTHLAEAGGWQDTIGILEP